MPTVIDLPELYGRIRSAETLLAQSPNTAGVHRAVDELVTVDGLLGSLVAGDTLPDDIAAGLGRIRDDLSSHVSAALHLAEIAPTEQTVALLQRGIAAAHMGIIAVM